MLSAYKITKKDQNKSYYKGLNRKKQKNVTKKLRREMQENRLLEEQYSQDAQCS